jgi:hypothetical protein
MINLRRELKKNQNLLSIATDAVRTLVACIRIAPHIFNSIECMSRRDGAAQTAIERKARRDHLARPEVRNGLIEHLCYVVGYCRAAPMRGSSRGGEY